VQPLEAVEIDEEQGHAAATAAIQIIEEDPVHTPQRRQAIRKPGYA
jgi:hypothetical protein